MYKLIIKGAFLSLFRRKSRSLLVVLMIVFSLWGLIFIQGFYMGMTKQMIDNAIRSDSGELSIFAKNFRKEREAKLQITNSSEVLRFIQQDKNVKSSTIRVSGKGLIATASYSKNADIYGINLKAEKQHANLDAYIKTGNYNFGKKQTGAIIGAKLAEKLKLKIGKKIILTSQDANNELSSIRLTITALIKTNNMGIDQKGVFIDINKAKDFFAISGINQISISFNNDDKNNILQKQLKQKFTQIEVFKWNELYPALLQGKELMETFNLISYMIVFIAVAIGILGVILISVFERLREFSILIVIGTKFKYIMQMIFLESLIMSSIGFILGAFFAAITLFYFSEYGLDLSYFSKALDEFGIDSIVYTFIDSSYFVNTFFALFCATFLSVLIPLIMLKRQQPIRVING